MASFAFVADSPTLKDRGYDLAGLAAALEIQLNRDVAPIWTPKQTHTVTIAETADCLVTFTDSELERTAAGFHEASAAGRPDIWIQVLDCGGAVDVVTSHELIETLGNWSANLWSPSPWDADVARELCDPCEDQSYEIVPGFHGSNFVFPEWFDTEAEGKQVDFLKMLGKPLSLSPFGYVALMDGGSRNGSMRNSSPKKWRRGALIGKAGRHAQP